MMYEIAVLDRDYHTVTEIYWHFFSSKDKAEEYCKTNSWTGETYFLTGKTYSDKPA